jgi:predicted Na+-dependent transporter
MSKIVSYGLFLAIIAGFLFPAGDSLKWLIPYLLAIIMFFSFLKLDYKKENFFRKEIIYYLAVGLVMIPFVVYVLTFALEPMLRLGIFLVAITPTAISAPIVVDMIKGDRELIVSNVVIYNLLAPLTYTFMLSLYFGESDIAIPVKDIFVKLILMIFVPLIAALVVKRFVRIFDRTSAIKEGLLNMSRYVSPLSFILVIGVAVASASLSLRTIETGTLVIVAAIALALAIVSFGAGAVLGTIFRRKLSKKKPKREKEDDSTKKALMVIFGHKNSTLTTWIILSNFGGTAVIPIIIYIICHHVINSILIYKYAE